MTTEQTHLGPEFEKSAALFIAKLHARLESAGLTGEFSEIDHICYRVQTIEGYESMKATLGNSATLLSEAFINGRPIATYRLAQAINAGSACGTKLLELPAPREDAPYEEGFEHIEVVTLSPLELLLARHLDQPFAKKNFFASVNRDVSLQFEDGVVKFHEASLEKVIEAEQAQIASRAQRPLAILDFDDTLLNSRLPFLKTVQAALESFLGQAIPFDELRQKARPTFPEFFANFGIEGKTSVQDLLRLFQEYWPRFAKDCQRPAGIHSLLSCLQSAGVDLHVWTARDKITTVSSLEEAGLLKFFRDVHAFDENTQGKPVPPPSLSALCDSAAGVVLLGDSRSDLAAAAALDAKFFQATWVHGDDLDLPADSICPTPLNALSKIMEHLKGVSH